MAYPIKFREMVARAYDKSGSSIDVAKRFRCSEAWVRRLIQRRRETGSIAARPMQLPDNSKLGAQHLQRLKVLIRRTPDITLGELAKALGLKVSVTTIWRATRDLGLTIKKKSSPSKSRRSRTSKKRGRSNSGVPLARS